MTHDEALMWLNDHTDMPAAFHVYFDVGPVNADVVSHEQGSLEHWRSDEDLDTSVLPPHPREDIVGLYSIGGVTINMTELGHCEFSRRSSIIEPRVDVLRVQLDENVVIEILAWPQGVSEPPS